MKLLPILAAVALVACHRDKGPPAPDTTETDSVPVAAFSSALAPQSLAMVADTAALTQKFIIDKDTVSVTVRISSRRVDTVTVIRVDTVRVPTTPPPPPSTVGSAVFGPSGLDKGYKMTGVAPFTYTVVSSGGAPKYLYGNLQWAAANKLRVRVNMPGGSHNSSAGCTTPLKTPVLWCPPGTTRPEFRRFGWDSLVNLYNVPGMKDTLTKYWKAGVLVSLDVMDEPHVSGLGDGNTWGPAGTMTKVRVDSLCQYLKDRFPNVPVGVTHQPQVFEPSKNYKVCDNVNQQWSVRSGDIKAWVKLADSIAKRQGTQNTYSINWRNGGIQDKDGTHDCKNEGGVLGSAPVNCAMTPDTVKAALLYLGTRTYGGQMMWNYDSATVVRNKAVLQQVADSLKKVPYKPLTRR